MCSSRAVSVLLVTPDCSRRRCRLLLRPSSAFVDLWPLPSRFWVVPLSSVSLCSTVLFLLVFSFLAGAGRLSGPESRSVSLLLCEADVESLASLSERSSPSPSSSSLLLMITVRLLLARCRPLPWATMSSLLLEECSLAWLALPPWTRVTSSTSSSSSSSSRMTLSSRFFETSPSWSP
ncbi:uncharacterized protein B0I36DRAFT_334363 [Microdochium trichocladiopsis]|uniref:Transmembrane protein n=1 Tax=Microdochium trichocladiopsis TaxID=1682393 RepID=A0A9P9BIA7_9PEZI|nr:uncharacterized protein B0I36DRAFT_334363 [Microdochium trichocladiopsis]KAH7021385.1 hypothetical protein B0I36DRAFT_334363 [Microdochium trichocladiopsis]